MTLTAALSPPPEEGAPHRSILVIKLGALGDFVQAMGPAAAIRAHHLNARITLLTTQPFASLARACPYVDDVWIDERPSFGDVVGLWRLRARLRAGAFDRVYDLQTSERSSAYRRLLGGRFGRKAPEWSGIAAGCSHPHANPERDFMHTIDRQADQLRLAGIASVPPPELGWAAIDAARLLTDAGIGEARELALLVPGGSAHRPEKRWPADAYAALARELAAEGLAVLLLGGSEEAALGRAIAASSAALDLTGHTSIGQIVWLAGRARLAVGNDTGPMHAIAACGCPSIVLFSGASDPALTAPCGPHVTVLRRAPLASLDPAEVAGAVRLQLQRQP